MLSLDVTKALCTERGISAMYVGASGDPKYPHLIRTIYDTKTHKYNHSGVSVDSYLPRIINAWRQPYYR